MEKERLLSDLASWRLWGPYLSERQWGTVREDYSENGDAWNYFPHDHARSRAYRWGEDGIAGISDEKQILCFALAMWNGNDPILKERLFGLNGHQGNHGEDVKEYYFYLDNIPSHAYMKYLYKYPHKAYPYEDLIQENSRRTRLDPEYELLDTGIFNENRYFDVFVEYAKASPEDILIKITIANRGPESAKLELLPTLWFRNTWDWEENQEKPELSLDLLNVVKASHPTLGDRWLYCEKPSDILFTNNETNNEKIFKSKNRSPHVKDGINDYIVHGVSHTINRENWGTKASALYDLHLDAGEEVTVRLRLSSQNEMKEPFGGSFTDIFTGRLEEANAFYKQVTPFPLSDDMRNVQRQAFAGLLWNKQMYHYNVTKWLDGDKTAPPPPKSRQTGRNATWRNFDAHDIFSMPDKWEYPWFAAWDSAFHTISFALIDPDFAKSQLHLLVREWYMHPNGQIPAYEWSFSDVNPPVHAWAALRIYQIESKNYGKKDIHFLKQIFHKLVLNFTWWVNRKDAEGRNLFEGGFLGLDNISAFNRSSGTPGGSTLEQCDSTSWMGMYCLNLLQIALEIATEDSSYEEMATKFFEHFVDIADAMNNIGGKKEGLWDEERGFYYGELLMPDGRRIELNHDTIIGIIPLFAIAVNDPLKKECFHEYRERFMWLIKHHPEKVENIVEIEKFDIEGKLMISLASAEKMRRILSKVLDESIFLSPFGVRSLSKQLEANPFVLNLEGKSYTLNYEPAESTVPLFGGNSNWRGPIWFPLNYLLIESLQKYDYYLGKDFKVECPTGSGKQCTVWEVTTELTHRLIQIFLKDKNGKRPVYGGMEKFQNDPHWKDYILFHEYFHGDNGAGLGASNQTGWTGLVAKLIHQYGEYGL